MIKQFEVTLDLGELGKRDCILGMNITNIPYYSRPQANFSFFMIWNNQVGQYFDMTSWVDTREMKQHFELMVEERLEARSGEREFEPDAAS